MNQPTPAARQAHLCPAPAPRPHGRPGRRRALALVAVCAVIAAGLSLWPRVGSAKSQRLVHYPLEQVWPAMIRFLRVDAGCEIRERDQDAGYILFTLPDEGKEFSGSLEIVRVQVGGRDALRLLIGIDSRPAYMEEGLLDRFQRKLRAELGPPPRPAPTPAPAEPPPSKDGDGDESAALAR
ncbi:MAG: hypothetical protein Tsb0020_11520 [Haliangiales bacterium]